MHIPLSLTHTHLKSRNLLHRPLRRSVPRCARRADKPIAGEVLRDRPSRDEHERFSDVGPGLGADFDERDAELCRRVVPRLGSYLLSRQRKMITGYVSGRLLQLPTKVRVRSFVCRPCPPGELGRHGALRELLLYSNRIIFVGVFGSHRTVSRPRDNERPQGTNTNTLPPPAAALRRIPVAAKAEHHSCSRPEASPCLLFSWPQVCRGARGR